MPAKQLERNPQDPNFWIRVACKGQVRLTNEKNGLRFMIITKRHGKYSLAKVYWNLYHPDDLVKEGETIHHANGNKYDNRPENLIKLSAEEHIQLHKNNPHLNIHAHPNPEVWY